MLLSLFSPWLLLINLFCTLFMAQGGYLHLTRTSLRSDNFFWSNSGLVQTVFALWVSVPMTLYLVDKLWWLSHCKYWSVWVGLWYTVNDMELSASGVTKVSRKGMPPFPWVPWSINLIAQSMLLICSRNSCLWILCWMTQVSSTGLNQNLGGLESDQRASLSKCSMYRLATMGLPQPAHIIHFEMRCMYYADWTPEDLWCSVLITQFCSATTHPFPIDLWYFESWVYWNRNEECSYIIWCKTLSQLESYLFSLVYKVTCTLYMVGDLPTNDLSTLLRTLATPWVTEPPLETIGLSGVPVLWIWGNP